MDIQKYIGIILNAAKIQETMKDFELVQYVLELSDNELENNIIKLKGTGNKKQCSASFSKNTLYFQCFDCCKEPNHVYCQECYMPEKHQNHVVTYNYLSSGCCDCGDTLIMKKKSFCNKHSQSQIEMPIPEKLFGINLTERLRQFIMISFGLLFECTQKIVDYTNQTIFQIQNAIQILNLENSLNFIEDNKQELLDKQIAKEQGQKLYTLLFKILKYLSKDNIPWSYAISKFLQIPIDVNIQKFIKLYHVHSNDPLFNFKLDKQQQICQCSILNLIIKHYVFFSRFLQQDSNNISDLFYEFHVDDNFKPYICKQIIINFNHLYNPIQKFKLITINNQEIKITLNTINYTEYKKINEIFPKLAQDKNITKIYCKNKVERASIFGYFYQLIGHLMIVLINLKKESKNPNVYSMFELFSNQLLQLPICNYQSQLFCQSFEDIIVQQFNNNIVKKLFEQISEILYLEDDKFKFSSILPNNPIFSKLQQNSLLIYVLTKIYPCQQTETTTFHFLNPDEQIKFQISLEIQISTLQNYRKMLSVLVETWKDVYKQNKIGSQNIFRLVINYFINNYITSFTLKSGSKLQNYLSNIVICDRNFITLLSLFLIDYNDSQEAQESLLETSGLKQNIFKQVMIKLLKRTLLNIIVLNKKGNPSLYKGQIKLYNKQLKLQEVSLEQVDVAYIQLYAFLFGSEGINDIISNYIDIATFFNYKPNPQFLICRIAQTDYDLIQCVGDIFGQDSSEQFQKGLNKLFQTIFFVQSFYKENELRELLKQFSYDSSINLQNLILSSCVLNQDNEQLQLKRSLLPVQYEPIYAQLVLKLKDQITDKLRSQNDLQSELFGTSLENELNLLNQHKSTLTYKRQAILKAIAADKEQIVLQNILENLLIQQQQGEIQQVSKILVKHSVYINLVLLCNKNFQNPYSNLSQYLQAISQICLHILENVNLTQTINNIFSIFVKQIDDKLIGNYSQIESDAQKACKTQIKKKLYLEKFNNMSQSFNSQIQVDTPTQNTTVNCSLCLLQFENDQLQYRGLLITYSNIHQFIDKLPKLQNQKVDFFSIIASSCQHTFHKKCLAQYKQQYVVGDFQYLRCPICKEPYNFPFINSIQIQSTQDKILLQNFEFFLRTLNDNKIMEYYQKHTINNELNIPSVLDEIFSQVLCNLLFQLLSDLTQFKEKNTHLLLQDVLILLRIIYQKTQNTILEQIQDNDNQILFKIIKLLLQTKIKQNNINQLKSGLDNILYGDVNKTAIQEALTQHFIIAQFEQQQLSYDIQKIRFELEQNYIEKFQLNFKDFLIKHYLKPCQKKSCQFLPLSKINNQEPSQFICLICFKKMCAHYCGKPSKKNIGNLSRHCSKKHNGKTIYLYLRNSQVVIMQQPYIITNNNPLFKNLLGELPFIGNYQSSHYEQFNLNVKAINQIIEIIFQDKFIHSLIQNPKKVQQTTM
ncbi:unnamed protein product [Paramecium pentaurelia]|uniref:RING-type E3 ubiquitin transferase n=1 Tax=Paramecium pentaurelia TaxID=43138 RepID=A0A8S1X9D2_9CILI|nr:unnamed protein product [Paramecium pentaurelia]